MAQPNNTDTRPACFAETQSWAHAYRSARCPTQTGNTSQLTFLGLTPSSWQTASMVTLTGAGGFFMERTSVMSALVRVLRAAKADSSNGIATASSPSHSSCCRRVITARNWSRCDVSAQLKCRLRRGVLCWQPGTRMAEFPTNAYLDSLCCSCFLRGDGFLSLHHFLICSSLLGLCIYNPQGLLYLLACRSPQR